MRNITIPILATAMLFTEPYVQAESPIRDAETLDEIKAIVQEVETNNEYAGKKKLYVFDRDEVLIHRIGNECGSKHFKKWRALFLEYFWKDAQEKPQYGLYKSMVYRDHTKTLVDDHMPEFVQELQKAGNKCVVLTSTQNEEFKGGEIKSSHEIYKQELENFGYDFAKDWGELELKFLG